MGTQKCPYLGVQTLHRQAQALQLLVDKAHDGLRQRSKDLKTTQGLSCHLPTWGDRKPSLLSPSTQLTWRWNETSILPITPRHRQVGGGCGKP